ncbi:MULTISPECIES: phosphohistidine phosphatase SixA [Spirulina sp. CCY15215]|uniref:phosphohistidine phosphatase SixA n=1 Tax=Spirulina sp. CCY15215 TaxID=2767591 RepID=UPI001951BF6A|nr:phosphohistidine phosphatase SixA [Spirulina major]
MYIYLIRHGIAGDRAKYSNDADRPLTDIGRNKTKKVAKRLFDLDLRFDIILTSPLVRAMETAKILQEVQLCKKIETFEPLSPNGDINIWINWYALHKSCNSIALVGHQPDLGNWAEILTWGKTQEKLIVKKAGVIGVRISENGTPIGNSEIFLLSSPKWLV